MPSAETLVPETTTVAARRAWVHYCQAPDEHTFAPLYESTVGFIFSIAYRILRDQDDAMDAVQQVYAELVLAAHDAAQRDAIADINDHVRREALRKSDAMRKRRERRGEKQLVLEDCPEPHDSSPGACMQAQSRQVREKIDRAVALLPDEYRLPIILHFLHDMTHPEIAEALGLDRSTVSKRISKGLKRLEPMLRKAGLAESLPVLVALSAGTLLVVPATLNAATVYAKATAALHAAQLAAAAGQAAVAQTATTQAGTAAHGTSALVKTALLLAKPQTIAAATFAAAIVCLALWKPFNASQSVTSSGSAPMQRMQTAAAQHQTNATPADAMPRSNKTRLTTPGTASAAASGSISGQLVSSTDRRPIGGMRIDFASYAGTPAPGSFYTDDQGWFRIPRLPDGSYSLTVAATPVWVSRTLNAQVHRSDDTELGQIEINALGTIRGRLVVQPGEKPVAGETVNLGSAAEKNWPKTVTDKQGQFTFSGLQQPLYQILMPKRGYLDRQITFDSGPQQEVVIELGRFGIKGQISRGGVPCTSATVKLLRFYEGKHFIMGSFADENGCYTVPDLCPGTWQIEVYPPSKTLARQKICQKVEIPADRFVELNVTLPSAVLAGEVVDESGHPVSGARVCAICNSTSVALESLADRLEIPCSADGRFTMEGLPPGTHLITASAPGFGPAPTRAFRMPEAGNADPARIVLGNSATGTVVSTALNMSSGEPLKEAWITISGDNGVFAHSTSRDERGRAVIAHLAPGTYQVQVSAFGFSVARHTVQVAEKPVELRDVLYEAGGFKWHLLDPQRGPLADVPCRLLPEDPTSIESSRSGASGPDGTWVARGIYPGRYTALACINGKWITQAVTVSPHNLTEIRHAALSSAITSP